MRKILFGEKLSGESAGYEYRRSPFYHGQPFSSHKFFFFA